jgi:ABC-2 type transport system ATP-binding protein
MSPSVVVSDITKHYGRVVALTELSFSVAPGSIYGLIGPNGAGKTTTLAILGGLLQPTAGRASILGIEVQPNRRELVSKVGFASTQFSFFDYLTGRELLLAFGLLHGLGSTETKRRMDDLLELFDLEAAAGHYLYQYSQGMRQKLGVACALIHAPEVLLLDEPFLGLDSTSVYRLVRTLRKLAASGRTILLSSHELALVERLADRVGILHEGNLKREIELAPAGGRQGGAGRESGLESTLWEVVGAPEMKELSWI